MGRGGARAAKARTPAPPRGVGGVSGGRWEGEGGEREGGQRRQGVEGTGPTKGGVDGGTGAVGVRREGRGNASVPTCLDLTPRALHQTYIPPHVERPFCNSRLHHYTLLIDMFSLIDTLALGSSLDKLACIVRVRRAGLKAAVHAY